MGGVGATDNLEGRNQLPDVARRVLGGVVQKTEHVGREIGFAHAAPREQRALRSASKLQVRAIDGHVEQLEHVLERDFEVDRPLQ